MKKILSRIIFLIILIGFILSLAKIRVLKAVDFENKEILRIWKIENEEFTILYTHSVMLSPVTEKYYMSDDSIILKESTFKDYGAGLPSSTSYDFKYDEKNKVFKIYNIDEKMENLVYKVASERANQKILIDGETIEFKNFSREKVSVEFKIDRVSLLEYILNRGGN